MSDTRQLVSLSIHRNFKHYNMLDDKDNKLPDATENQSADSKESVKKTAKEKEIKELSSEVEKLEENITDKELTIQEKDSVDEDETGNKNSKSEDADEEIVLLETKNEKPEEVTSKEPEVEEVKEEAKVVKVTEEEVTKTKDADKEIVLLEAKKEKPEEVIDKGAEVEEVKEEAKAVKVTEEEVTKTKDAEKELVVPEDKEEGKSQVAVDEVEKHIAKKLENLHKVSEVPMEDYKALKLEGVVAVINDLIEKHPIQAIKKHVDVLKKVFNKNFGNLLKEAKKEFLDQGGNTIDFYYKNPIQEQYNKLLFEYKKRLKKYYKELEKNYEENLLRKNNVIEELKDLIDNGEANSMYKQFNTIQEKWREIGPVAREHYSNLWQTYHFHIERFYDLLHLRNDLRDLDFKHNLEEKIKLIAQAESLSQSDNIKNAFDELQILHRRWKEEIGPVARKDREDVWDRFSAATKKIHDKRHEFFDGLKDKFNENLLKKESLIDEINAYDTLKNKTHRDWQRSIKDFEGFREQFFAIGRVPRSKNNAIWNKFKEVTKEFNKKKNTYYKGIKEEQHENLNRKIKLVEKAESFRESEDWDTVTEVMKKIQAEWKTIGHVPRKHSDKIWKF